MLVRIGGVGRRGYSFRSARFSPQQYVETEFEKKWRTMPEHEKSALEGTFQELEQGDWRHLTKDQIRNSTLHVTNSLYGLLWSAGPEGSV